MPTGNFPEMSSRQILVGIILVGRSGVHISGSGSRGHVLARGHGYVHANACRLQRAMEIGMHVGVNVWERRTQNAKKLLGPAVKGGMRRGLGAPRAATRLWSAAHRGQPATHPLQRRAVGTRTGSLAFLGSLLFKRGGYRASFHRDDPSFHPSV